MPHSAVPKSLTTLIYLAYVDIASDALTILCGYVLHDTETRPA
jgi:hypothetical protein